MSFRFISRWLMVGLLILGLAAACSPAAEQQSENSTTPIEEPSPAETTEDTADPQGPVETADGTLVAAPPGAVDLDELLEEEPPDEELLEEMPQPGRPNRPRPAAVTRTIFTLTNHLARYTDVPRRDIEFVGIEQMSWGSTALGCPAPDTAYSEVAVDGWLITLEAAGEPYTYHTEGLARFVLCEDGRPVAEGDVGR